MKDLLSRALEAHGGLSRWREIEAFQLKVSIGGGLWRLKGLPDGLRDGGRPGQFSRSRLSGRLHMCGIWESGFFDDFFDDTRPIK
jgi:hypothetical protein